MWPRTRPRATCAWTRPSWPPSTPPFPWGPCPASCPRCDSAGVDRRGRAEVGQVRAEIARHHRVGQPRLVVGVVLVGPGGELVLQLLHLGAALAAILRRRALGETGESAAEDGRRRALA